jgi:alkylhydroperoxidase family enzyme
VTNRIPLLNRDQIDPSLLELPAYLRSNSPEPFNIYRTLAHHPAMVRKWLEFADALRFEAKLSGRDRELLILRTGVNCHCEYEWGQHVPYARASGILEEELLALHRPVESHPWADNERALLTAADELHASSDLSEATWLELATFYSNDELIEVIMLVGQYHLVSFVLNSFRVERDADLEPFPPPAD